jgi:hypothetical protein
MGEILVSFTVYHLDDQANDGCSTNQLKSQNSALLEKMTGGVLTKEIEEEMKTIIKSHVADFSA